VAVSPLPKRPSSTGFVAIRVVRFRPNYTNVYLKLLLVMTVLAVRIIKHLRPLPGAGRLRAVQHLLSLGAVFHSHAVSTSKIDDQAQEVSALGAEFSRSGHPTAVLKDQKGMKGWVYLCREYCCLL
jgi:hypothetical protein